MCACLGPELPVIFSKIYIVNGSNNNKMEFIVSDVNQMECFCSEHTEISSLISPTNTK